MDGWICFLCLHDLFPAQHCVSSDWSAHVQYIRGYRSSENALEGRGRSIRVLFNIHERETYVASSPGHSQFLMLHAI